MNRKITRTNQYVQDRDGNTIASGLEQTTRQQDNININLDDRVTVIETPRFVPVDNLTLHCWPCDDPFYGPGVRGRLRDIGTGNIPMVLYEDFAQFGDGIVLPRSVGLTDTNTALSYCDTAGSPNSMTGAKGTGWAISYWVKRLSSTSRQFIVGYVDTPGVIVFGLYCDANGNVIGTSQNTISGAQSTVSTAVVSANVWHHVAFVFHENSARFGIIVDGAVVRWGGFAAGDQINWVAGVAPRKWFIGYPAAAYGNAIIQDVRVHSTSRMLSDMTTYTRPATTSPGAPILHPAAYWQAYYRTGMGMQPFPSIDPVT